MASQFVRIGEETNFALSFDECNNIKSIDDYILLCRDLYEYVKTCSNGSVDMPSRSTEFHYFGVTGAPGGEILAPMIWAISHFPAFFAKLSNARTAFILGSPTELVLASSSIETVYTANHPSVYLLNKVRPTMNLDNVTTLSWSTVRNSLPQLDFAQVVINYIADESILNAVLGAINVGGLLIISNSSNAGELYDRNGGGSFPHKLHEDIKATGNFDVMHMQGYISYTLCVRR